MEPWIQTYTGKKFWLNNPTLDSICIEDIAHALSMLCRFNGHTKEFYSVAQHSVLATALVEPDYKLFVLLHDASEAYTGDLTRPLKDSYTNMAFKTMDSLIQLQILAKYDVAISQEVAAKIKLADAQMLRWEGMQLFTQQPIDNWIVDLPKHPYELQPIFCWSQKRAKQEFLTLFHALTEGRFYDGLNG